MVAASIILASVLFGLSQLLEMLAVFPRISGAVVGLHGIGYSYAQMVHTVKRIFIVSYPPFLGYILIAGNIYDIFAAVGLSYAMAAAAFFTVAAAKRQVLATFCGALESFRDTGHSIRSIYRGVSARQDWVGRAEGALGQSRPVFSRQSVDGNILLLAAWIFFFYSSSLFTINLAAFILAGYAAVILQMTGFVNAFGTFVLAFCLDPKLSRIYQEGRNLGDVLHTLMLSHALNVFCISPAFFALFYAAVWVI